MISSLEYSVVPGPGDCLLPRLPPLPTLLPPLTPSLLQHSQPKPWKVFSERWSKG